MLPIAELVQNNLGETLNFVAAGPDATVLSKGLPLREGEKIVGWYQNPAPQESTVIFTDRSLWFSEGESIWCLPYRDISSWRNNDEAQQEITGLKVCCRNEWLTVPFTGRSADGESIDALKFANILSTMIRTPREKLVA
jgi:hypothetical protein